MSLADRLTQVTPYPSNRGCVTCHYLDSLTKSDRKAWDDWIASGKSLAQLHEIATTDPDNPLKVSLTGFRHHQRAHGAR